MRKVLCIAVLNAAIMLLLPLSVLKETAPSVETTVFDASIPDSQIEAVESFRVYNSKTEEITEIKTEDYIFGVVAAEMPALYHEEALKAQAVAAYTYACRKKAANSKLEYDITTDYTIDQSFTDEQTAREKWGNNADEYVEKIRKAVKDTEGYVITYDNKLIAAVYHSISAGKTEDCKNVWGSDTAYLKSVPSEGDKLSPNFMSVEKFSADEIKEKFSGLCEFNQDTENWFSKSERTDCGTVKEIVFCDKTLSGDKVRSLLNLRSANFEVEYKDGEFEFTVYGYGHGVGMSQYGADYMAKQGFDFKEILNHYYTDCKIEKIK